MAKRKRTRVFVVDDHPVVRYGLAQLINGSGDLRVCGEAADAPTAMSALVGDPPDVAVIDLSLGQGSGIGLIEEIHARFAAMPLLVLSMHDEALYAERVLRAGARGYVMKSAASERLVEAIRKVLAGEIYLSARIKDRLLTSCVGPGGRRGGARALSNRELEVLEMLGEGYGAREIARRLSLSVKTIETHFAHLKRKLGLQSARELTRYAIRWAQKKDEC
jgi:DNA-binding NarL/FixJ family response regulator